MRRPLATLAAALLLALALPVSALEWHEAAREEVAPGLVYRMLRAGAPAEVERHRLVLGPFEGQRAADQALARVEAAGLAALPESDGSVYRVVVGELAAEEVEAVRARLLAAGFPAPIPAEASRHDLGHRDGPWEVHLLAADPRRVRAKVASAADAAIGLETTRSLAVRRGAAAAVNGGYFAMEGLLAGDAQGVLVVDGRLLSEPDRGRAAVGFLDTEEGFATLFGRLAADLRLALADGSTIAVDGVDRRRGDDEVVVYTPEFHRTTLTGPGGVEVVVAGGRVTAVREGVGSSAVPTDGFVASFGPQAARAQLAAGDELDFTTELSSLFGDPAASWAAAHSILGGGPLLLWRGERVEDHRSEAISRVFWLARHPRTAAAVRADGTLLLVAVDGRDPQRSVGMSLPELTDLLLHLGAVTALNLDGGGSTTLVVGDEVRNGPSDSRGERANGDAILLFPRPRAGAPVDASDEGRVK